MVSSSTDQAANRQQRTCIYKWLSDLHLAAGVLHIYDYAPMKPASTMSDSSDKMNSFGLDPAEVADFQDTLRQAKRIVAVLGAGISASSGLATFRSDNGLWKNQDVVQVASPAGFRYDPGLVWQFYSYRRHEALRASPNAGHYALAELARRVPGFMTLSQNVDNLSPRADHPAAQLRLLHGDLFNLRCFNQDSCGYEERGNFQDPLVPALDVAKDEAATIGSIDPDNMPKASPVLLAGIARKHARILGDTYQDKSPVWQDTSALRAIPMGTPGHNERPSTTRAPDVRLSSGLMKDDLPQCPKCKVNLLRPGVVWFGEALPVDIVTEIEAMFEHPEPIDLFLTIGTSSKVWPAAGYADLARKKGARVATVNLDAADALGTRPGRDWVFVGDAAAILPVLLKPVIGEEHEWKGKMG